MEKLLAAGENVDAQNDTGWTALIAASAKGRRVAVKILLGAKANPNITDNYGLTALIYAALYPENIGLVLDLIEGGANVNIRSKRGYTALTNATENGDINAVNALLNAGADVDIKGEDGKTALEIAKEEGHKKVVKILERAQEAKGISNGACQGSF